MSGLAGLTRKRELAAQRKVVPANLRGMACKPDPSTPSGQLGFSVGRRPGATSSIFIRPP
jgi:hypothetical protein